MSTGRAVLAAAALGALSAVELVAARVALGAWGRVLGPGPAAFDEAVVVVVLTGCALLGGWLLLGTTIAVLGHLPHLPQHLAARAQESASRWTPHLAQRVAAVLVGTALGSGAVAPGAALGEGSAPDRAPGFAVTRNVAPDVAPAPSPIPAPTPAPTPGWTPSRPAPAPPVAAHLVTGASALPSGEVVVHRGESLWSIARRHLGPGATDVEVAAAWPRWYAANRDLIGPDPDRLLPGQVLRPPEPGGATGPLVHRPASAVR